MAHVPSMISISTPQPRPAIVDGALRVLTGSRDPDRRALLARALTDEERRALATRSKDLEPFANPGTAQQKGEEIAGMLMGLKGQALSLEEARAVAVQYVKTCAELPLWAVARACHRFATGQVRAEEIGQEGRLDPNWRPSTAALYRVAAKMAEPVQEERFRIGEAMRGTLMIAKRAETEEERVATAERINAKLKETRAALAAEEVRQAAERSGRMLERRDEARRASAAFIEQEYRAAGLEPPPWQGDIPPVSLAVMLSMGWTIADGPHGEKVLIKPKQPRDRGPTPQPPGAKGDAELNDKIPF